MKKSGCLFIIFLTTVVLSSCAKQNSISDESKVLIVPSENVVDEVSEEINEIEIESELPEIIEEKTLIYEESTNVPDGLNEFLNGFSWAVENGNEYDSETGTGNLELIDRFMGQLLCDFDGFPVNVDKKDVDGLNYSFDAEALDWILANIYHFSDESLKEIKKDGYDPIYSYKNGRYNVIMGGVGGGYEARNTRVAFNGETYYICYDLYYLDFDSGNYLPSSENKTHYALMDNQEIEGKNYWTIYKDSTKSFIDFEFSEPQVNFEKDDAIKYIYQDLINRYPEECLTEEYLNDYFDYQLVRVECEYGTVFFISYGVYRLSGGDAFVFSDGTIVHDYDATFNQYKNILNFDPSGYNPKEYEKFTNDPTYEKGGFGYE